VSYRIERSEALWDGIRRVGSEEIALALADLGATEVDGAVHSIRKRLKRLRALLRLAADDRHDRALRDAGRTLAHARDRRVAADTARRLAAGDDGAVARVAHVLAQRASGGPPLARAALDGLALPLRALQADLAALGGGRGHDDDVLKRSVRRTWADGRRRFAVAYTWPTAEHLHEWRKRVKDLWYQSTLLAEVAPGAAPLVDDLDRLGDKLGIDHDHAVLRDLTFDSEVCPEGDRPVVHQALEAARSRLQQVAWPIGFQIYSGDPDAFVAAYFAPSGGIA